jgi:hypothetical protein
VQLADDIIDAAIAVRNARKLPADLVAMSVTRYGQFLKLKDTANRPLMPQETAGPMNVIGVGAVAVDGRLQGLGVIATGGLPAGTYPESIVVLRAADTVLFVERDPVPVRGGRRPRVDQAGDLGVRRGDRPTVREVREADPGHGGLTCGRRSCRT